jgi:hypothetical protein
MDLGSAAGVAVAQLLDRTAAAAAAGASDVRGGQCPSIAVQDTNVTAVQDVLKNVYNQSFHGPPSRRPPSPPAPPAPGWYAVSGAGDASWDGNYTLRSTVYQGHAI